MADGSVVIGVGLEEDNVKKELDNIGDAADETAKDVEELGDEAKKTGKELEDLGDSAGKSEKGLDALDVAAGSLAAGGISALAGAVMDAVSGFMDLADETREYREDMAKLNTAFKTSGHRVEDAQKAYDDFYKILGESDRSVEAVNHLAELTDNTEDLSKWSTIAAGVTAKFGDSLPIEGLTEAANETAKVGAVTGPLADALNWAGISEEKFNEQLAKCNSEQERASLITATLTTEYSEAAAEYNTLTASTQAAREATNKMEQAQAALGAKMEPMKTAFTQLTTLGIEAMTPALEALSGMLYSVADAMLNGSTEAGKRAVAANRALASVREEAEAYRELKIAQFEQSAGDLAHIENARLLYQELTGLVDANGRVDEANKARAEFITTTLSEALGVELGFVGNQIQNYDKLKTSVENAIAAKQAEILLANDLEAYTAALENRTKKESEQAEKLVEISEQRQKVTEAEMAYDEAAAAYKEKTANFKTDAEWRTVADQAKALEELKKTRDEERGTLDTLQTAYDENEELLKQYYLDISTYQEAQSLIFQGKTDEAIKLLDEKNNAFFDSSEIVGEATEEQKKKLEDIAIATGVNAVLMRERYNKGVKGVTEEMVKTAEEAAEKAKTEFEKVGGNIGDGIGTGADAKKPGLLTKIKNIVSAMKKAAEEEADINSPSKEFAWIGEMMMEGLSGGVDHGGKKAVESVRNVGAKMLKESRKSAEKQVKSLEKQLDDLAEVREAKNEKLSELDRKQNEKQRKQLETEIKNIDKKRKLLQKEFDIAREKEQALNSFATKYEVQLDDLISLEEEYSSKHQSIFDKLKEDSDNALENYQTTFNNRVQSIKNSLGIFDIVEKKEKASGSEMTKALRSQVGELEKYNTALETLFGRNVSAEFYEEFAQLGVAYLPQLEAINRMTDEQLAEYVTLWEQKTALASDAATKELAGERGRLDTELAQLRTDALKEADDLKVEYNGKMLELLGEISSGMLTAGNAGIEALGETVSGYVEAGASLMEGVADGMASKQSEIIQQAVSAVRAAISAAKAEADIHSPSRVTKDEIGANLALGVAEGWEDTLSRLRGSMSSGMSGITDGLRATVSAENARYGFSRGAADVGFTELARAVNVQTAGINSLATSQRGGTMRPIILQLDKRELGRAVVDVSGAETVRVGTKLTGGATT